MRHNMNGIIVPPKIKDAVEKIKEILGTTRNPVLASDIVRYHFTISLIFISSPGIWQTNYKYRIIHTMINTPSLHGLLA